MIAYTNLSELWDIFHIAIQLTPVTEAGYSLAGISSLNIDTGKLPYKTFLKIMIDFLGYTNNGFKSLQGG